jgi:hypothetical protein
MVGSYLKCHRNEERKQPEAGGAIAWGWRCGRVSYDLKLVNRKGTNVGDKRVQEYGHQKDTGAFFLFARRVPVDKPLKTRNLNDF